MANEKVLIVEDDIELSELMGTYLQNEGFDVKRTYSGKSAIEMAKTCNPDIIILDIMLPQVDGMEVCRNVRMHSHAPVIIISAKSSDYDKVVSFGVGADDYLTKPFSLVELVARVKSHVRRYTMFGKNDRTEEEEQVKEFGKLRIYPKRYKVEIDGKEINFTSKEFKILDYLSSHPGMVYSKEQLMDDIWGYSECLDENTIAVYIGRLREKLVKEGITAIKTVWGVGYKWEM